MFDVTLPLSELPIMGYNENTDYFQQHRDQWEQEVLAKLHELGYPVELWPSGSPKIDGFIRYWKGMGHPRNPAPIMGTMDKTPYSGPQMPAGAAKMFFESFPHVTDAMFCITRGEDWWPYDKAFVCNDAQSYALYVLYTAALMNPSILDKPVEKKIGRPRNEAAHAAKAEKTARYQEWLLLCEAHRAELALAENAYREAWAASEKLRIEFNALKARGAPKWIP